jgi:predicted chitinase
MQWSPEHPVVAIVARTTSPVRPATEVAAPLLAAVATDLDLDDTPTGRRWVAQLGAQLAHESMGWRRFTESLAYRSADRLRETWPSRFAALTDAELAPLVVTPEMKAKARVLTEQRLATRVYGGRLGNTSAADAYSYRGRGAIMLTGRANYEAAGRDLGLPLLAEPHLAAEPAIAGRVAAWFIRRDVLPHVSDPTATREVRRRINGGAIGLDEVRVLVGRCVSALGIAGVL